MNEIAFALPAAILTGTFWFAVVYAACKGSYKRHLGWGLIGICLIVTVVMTGILRALFLDSRAQVGAGFGLSIGIPLLVSVLVLAIAFAATKPKVM